MRGGAIVHFASGQLRRELVFPLVCRVRKSKLLGGSSQVFSFLLFFKIALTFALFQMGGRMPSSKDFWKMVFSGCIMESLVSFRNLWWNRSGP